MEHNASPQAKPPTGELPASIAERKKFLAELVSMLSLDEIWLLRSTLASLDLRTDVYGRLPSELQFMVTAYLDPADLGACVDVSREWRRMVVEQILCRSVMMRCYPELLQYTEPSEASAVQAKALAGTGAETRAETETDTRSEAQTETRDKNGATSALVAATIITAARARTRLSRGEFHSVYHHCRAPALDPNMEMTHLSWLHPQNLHSKSTAEETDTAIYGKRVSAYRFAKYAYGRVVWLCMEALATSFLVDDLRTGHRFHLRLAKDVVRSRTFLFSAAGDEILVASTGMHLLAWKFKTGERDTKALPSRVTTVSTAGNRICLLLVSGRIYIWEFGGTLRQVDMTGLGNMYLESYRNDRLGGYFILHPKQAGVFYHETYQLETTPQDGPGTGKMCIHVHEYEGLHYVRTYTKCIYFTNGVLPAGLVDASSWQNSHGLHTVMTWQVFAPSSSVTIWLEGIRSVAFDIHTKRFTESFFRLPPARPPIRDGLVPVWTVHLWNDQMTVYFDRYTVSNTHTNKLGPPMLFVLEDELSPSALLTRPRPFFSVPFLSSENPPDEQELHDNGDVPDYSDDDDDEMQMGPIQTPTERSNAAAHYSSKITDPVRARRRQWTLDKLAVDKGVWNVDDVDWRKSGCRARYVLDLATRCVRLGKIQSMTTYIYNRGIYGDDDFVFFLHNNRYTVWCF